MSKKVIHPNSLANLTGQWNSETARAAQVNSVAARKANKAARAALKLTAHEMQAYKTDMKDMEVSAVSMLEMLMLKAFQEEDFDTAADLAKALAEFQTPKLARQDVSVEDKGTADMSDEELEAKLKELMDGQNYGNSDTEGRS